MRSFAIIVLGGVFLAQAALAETAPLPAGDPAAGKAKAGLCRTCHGLNGYARIPIAPHIGGENPAYIEHQLAAFRDGRRVHEVMTVVARGLDDQSIADLAAWFSGQSIQVALPAASPPEAAPQDCVACHGADGVALIPDAPNLAGENVIYIETQIKAFRTGKRQHEIMSPIAAELTDEAMRAAATWYANVALTVAPAL
ncbi:MAG: cytochrome c4 [Rhodobacterales bacterium]|nr:cytochrome c4 [Rhodobacterales bacterium]